MNTQKRYLIKKEYEATEKNTNNLGEKQTWYNGKQGVSMRDTDTAMYQEYFKANYCYNRLCDAKRALNSALKSAEWEMNKGWWNIKCSIVEV